VGKMKRATEFDCTARLFRMFSTLRSTGEDIGPSLVHHHHRGWFREMTRTGIEQLLAGTDFDELGNIKDLEASIEIAALLHFPDEHKYESKVVDDNTYVGHVLECYVLKMVSRARDYSYSPVCGKAGVEAMKLGAIDYLAKPVAPDDLETLIRETLLTGDKGRH
jgi:hypothetical protein